MNNRYGQVFAEYERALIQERTRRGQLFAARQGHVNWGNPPYGYTYVRKTVHTPQHLVINETEAEVVRQIYRWCVEEQMSSYAIHRRLTAQGIPPRKSTRGYWAQSSVMEILRDSIYKGEAYYNRTQPGDARRPYGSQGLKDRRPGNGQGRTRRPQSDWIPVRVPALIDPETWERAQAQLARNRERAQRHNTQHRYLLRSLLVCGRCGRRMVGTWSAQGGRYICALRYPRYVPGACTGRSLGAAMIEPCVWAHVKALLSDPAVLRAQYEQGHGDPAVDVRAEQERVRLERKLAALDREVTRLVDAYQAEVIELTELAERRRRIEDHGRMLRERVRDIAQQRHERSAELRLLEGVDAFCTSVREAMEEPSFTVQQKVLQLVVNRIVVEDGQVIVEHVVPTGPVRLQPEQQRPKKVHFTGCVDLQVFDTYILKRVHDVAYSLPFLSSAARLCRVIAETDVGVNTVFMQAISVTCAHSNLAHPVRSHAGINPFGEMGKKPHLGVKGDSLFSDNPSGTGYNQAILTDS